ncbi:unnamed protein product [Phytomonas sp. Hart1]|nr:unnamed protein product [Phytomonas sp. Hart1]|eukprot:CCW69301.1 unnamed protein product [Phytomonas sp. isolate Hart1]
MTTWLNVAEKPSVAKEIANALSGGDARPVPMSGRSNPVYKFSFNGTTMLVTSVLGHLMEDEFPPHTKSWARFPFRDLFTAQIVKVVKPELQHLQRNLETLAKRSRTLVLWLDCDREGENICFEVMKIAQRQNPQLVAKRAHFSALTKRDLLYAIQHLKEPNRNLSEAVEARQEMDFRIGAAFTRLQTIRYGDAFEGITHVLSFGPCQFPTLGFVVRRYWEQRAFVPEDYFTLQLRHGETAFRSCRGAMYDQVGATVVLGEMLVEAAANQNQCRVVNAQQRPRHRPPPVPLATVVLQKLASRHLHIPSERCMSLSESLYQEGFISYPRTETDAFSFQDAELMELVRGLVDYPPVSDFSAAMLADPGKRFRRPLKGSHDDHAHPPIHPIKAWGGPAGEEKGRLYTLIAQHFLASLSPDAVAATTSVRVQFGEEEFTTGGSTILERGYLAVYPYDNWHGSSIPHYQIGDRFVTTEVGLASHRTAAPADLTETDLITLMDDHGIGTDATIAQHIKTVIERGYVKRERQTLVPTTLGIALASAYDVVGLASLLQPQLRAQMELAMGDIVKGGIAKAQVVDASVKLYREIFDRLEHNGRVFYNELCKHLRPVNRADPSRHLTNAQVRKSEFMSCGVCHRAMELVENADGDRSSWHLRCLQCERQYRMPNGALNRLEPLSQRCALCSFHAVQVTNREKNTSYTICPHCFTNPPPEMESLGEFRCFQCTVSNCPLAKGLEQLAITRCQSCKENDLRLRSNATGYYLSCKGYPTCSFSVGLPKANAITPNPTQRCPTCQTMMLTFDFGAMPVVPGMDMVDTVCLTCDHRLQGYLVIRRYQPKNEARAEGRAEVRSIYTLPSVSANNTTSRRVGIKEKTTNNCNSAENVLCNCGVQAKKLVSRKETSKGKRFFTCANRQCNFFQWID